jgi:hypothetical protein
MSNWRYDRTDQMAEVNRQMDRAVQDILMQHQYLCDMITNSLVKYRKSCIRVACRDFSASYKVMKGRVSALITVQDGKFNDLLAELAQLQRSIQELQHEVLQRASGVLDSTEQIAQELRAQSNAIGGASARGRSRVAAMHEESRQRIAQLRGSHSARMKAERAQLASARKQLRTAQKNEMHALIRGLRSAIADLQSQYMVILDSYNTTMSATFQEKVQVVEETGRKILVIRREIAVAKAQNQEKGRLRIIAELEKRREQQNCDFLERGKRIRREARDLKRKWNAMAQARTNTQVDLDQKWTEAQERAMDGFQVQLDKQRYRNEQSQKELQAVHVDAERIIQSLKSFTEHSLNQARHRLQRFVGTLREQEDAEKTRLQESRKKFEQDFRDCSFDLRVVRGTILDEMRRRIIDAELQFEEKARVMKMRYKDYAVEESKRYADNEKTKASRLEEIRLRKQAEKRKLLSELSEKFEKELASRMESLQHDCDMQLAQCCTEFAPSEPVVTENGEIVRLKAKLAFLGKHIDDQAQVHRRRIERLENEITLIDKNKRRMERQCKSESQAIDDEYERNIAVEQVQLREKIENIAKHYSAEENHRGCGIIEAVRKVQDAEQRRITLRIAETHKHNEWRKNNSRELNSLKAMIEKVKNGCAELELQTRISESVATREAAVTDLAAKFNDQRQAILSRIEKEKQETEVLVSKVHAEEFQAATILDESRKQCLSQIHEHNTAAKQIMDTSQSEHDSVMNRLRVRYRQEIECSQHEIASARSKQEQLSESQIAIRSEMRNRLFAERLAKLSSFSAAAQSHTEKEQIEFDATIIETLRKDNSARFALVSPPMRSEEERRIQRKRRNLSAMNHSLVQAFEMHCKNLATSRTEQIQPVEALDLPRSPKKDLLRVNSFSLEPKQWRRSIRSARATNRTPMGDRESRADAGASLDAVMTWLRTSTHS